MEKDPHLLIEGMIIAALCHRLESDGVHLHPRRVLLRRDGPRAKRSPKRARRASSARGIFGTRLRLRHHRRTAAPARTSAARRRDSSSRSKAIAASRASSRRSPPSSACSAARRSSTTSRRSPACRSSSRTARSGSRLRHAEEHRPEALLRLRQREEAGRLRVPDGHQSQGAHLRALRRHHRRPQAEGGDPRRRVGADADAGRDRHPAQLRRA